MPPTVPNMELIEQVKDSIAFNLFMAREDGQVAWTVTPVTIEDLYSDPLSGCPQVEIAKPRIFVFTYSTRE